MKDPLPSREEKRTDARTVVDVANQLEIGEYRLFVLAYIDWSRHEPDPEIVGHSFGSYMWEGIVPPYVLRYARSVGEGLAAGTVSPESLGILPDQPTGPGQRRIGYLILILLAMVMALLFAVAHVDTALGEGLLDILPPPRMNSCPHSPLPL